MRLEPRVLVAGAFALTAVLVCVPRLVSTSRPSTLDFETEDAADAGISEPRIRERTEEAGDRSHAARVARASREEPRLRGILREGSERTALLGGHLVRAGDTLFGSMAVEDIADDRVIVTGPTGSVELMLPWYLARKPGESPIRAALLHDLSALLELVDAAGVASPPESTDP